MQQHTITQYREFQEAYDHFNNQIWESTLPQLMVTLQRKPRMLGHFAPERYQHRAADEIIHEIAMNPDGFVGETDREILSTLVHEMAHVWQQVAGKPGRRGYHNKEWAAEMKRIGLYPSNTGEPGGKELGEQMSHYIVDGGLFDTAYSLLVKMGFKLDWQSHKGGGAAGGGVEGDEDGEEPKKGRIKYTCPGCELNAWAKPDVSLLCGKCYQDGAGAITFMQPAEAA